MDQKLDRGPWTFPYLNRNSMRSSPLNGTTAKSLPWDQGRYEMNSGHCEVRLPDVNHLQTSDPWNALLRLYGCLQSIKMARSRFRCSATTERRFSASAATSHYKRTNKRTRIQPALDFRLDRSTTDITNGANIYIKV